MDFLRPRPWRTWATLTCSSSANRRRFSFTDAATTENAWAIAVFAKPSAAINNARARTTSRCGADDDRATVSRTSRCPGDTNRAGTGGRIPGSIPTNHQLITGHTTRYRGSTSTCRSNNVIQHNTNVVVNNTVVANHWNYLEYNDYHQ